MANVIKDHMSGAARAEVQCSGEDIKKNPLQLIELLIKRFGQHDSLQAVQAAFHSRVQLSGESLADFSRALMLLHSRMEAVAAAGAQHDAIMQLKDQSLIDQFTAGVTNANRIPIRQEKVRILKADANCTFTELCDEILVCSTMAVLAM